MRTAARRAAAYAARARGLGPASAAAALSAAWALGPGQAAYGESGYRSPRHDADSPDVGFRMIDEERLASERERWVDARGQLLTLGAPGPTG